MAQPILFQNAPKIQQLFKSLEASDPECLDLLKASGVLIEDDALDALPTLDERELSMVRSVFEKTKDPVLLLEDQRSTAAPPPSSQMSSAKRRRLVTGEKAVEQPIAADILSSLAAIFGLSAVIDHREGGNKGGKYADIHTVGPKAAKNLTGLLETGERDEPDYTTSFAHEVKQGPLRFFLVAPAQLLPYAVRAFGMTKENVLYAVPPSAPAKTYYSIATNIQSYGVARFTFNRNADEGVKMCTSSVLDAKDEATFHTLARVLKAQANTFGDRGPSATYEPSSVVVKDTASLAANSPQLAGPSTASHAQPGPTDTPLASGSSGSSGWALGALLGAGSTYKSYACTAPNGRQYCIKIARPEDEESCSYEQSVLQILGGIRGVPIFKARMSYWYHDGLLIEPVGKRFVRSGKIETTAAAVEVASQMMRTLRDVHGAQMQCNDISPQNLVSAEIADSGTNLEAETTTKLRWYQVDWRSATATYHRTVTGPAGFNRIFCSAAVHSKPYILAPADDIVGLCYTVSYLIEGDLPFIETVEYHAAMSKQECRGTDLFANPTLAEWYDWAVGLDRRPGTIIDYDGWIERLANA
ncbi:hypothetical protein HDU87_000333 [Geranomyces variabilis]|uniref:Uncharacterized protein n=1 Tax=Geranomyces variabilis TaxID=109894 RepID=A0AAD5XPC0_9FUNG|nr:hypothetical protein HDU87_000333 [Geranomyces variabilis]